MDDNFPYEDIVNLPHPESKRHPRMSMEARAAQFAPFAALSGHDEAMAETARCTTPQSEMSADQLQELSRKMNYVLSLPHRPAIEITFFQPDRHKQGGSYITVTGSIKKVEEAYNLLHLTDGTTIPLDAISDLSGTIFADCE